MTPLAQARLGNRHRMNTTMDINRQVRLAGLLYLAIILLGLWGEVAVRGTLVVPR